MRTPARPRDLRGRRRGGRGAASVAAARGARLRAVARSRTSRRGSPPAAARPRGRRSGRRPRSRADRLGLRVVSATAFRQADVMGVIAAAIVTDSRPVERRSGMPEVKFLGIAATAIDRSASKAALGPAGPRRMAGGRDVEWVARRPGSPSRRHRPRRRGSRRHRRDSSKDDRARQSTEPRLRRRRATSRERPRPKQRRAPAGTLRAQRRPRRGRSTGPARARRVQFSLAFAANRPLRSEALLPGILRMAAKPSQIFLASGARSVRSPAHHACPASAARSE